MSKVLGFQVDLCRLEKFCRQLLQRSRNTAATHEALITLEAFAGMFAGHRRGGDEYQEMMGLLQGYTERCRERLMLEKLELLLSVWRERDLDRLAQLYATLSRDGYCQIVKQARTRLSLREITELEGWVTAWLSEAGRLAAQASGYPDALDFSAAGIDVGQYHAMQDTRLCLGLESKTTN